MPTILSTDQLQINMNGASLPNARTRIFCLGTAVPGTSTWTTIIKFTHNGTAGTGLSMRWYMGAGRQSGTIAENWWVAGIGMYASTATTWTATYENWPWYSEGNGIIAYGNEINGTYVQVRAFQGDTGAWVETYVEAYSSNWDRITVSY